MKETVYLTLEGGIVQPLSDVSDELDTSNVVVYDGSTYRDDPRDVLNGNQTATGVANTYIGSASFVAAGVADPIAHVAPRYLGKQRTLWSFPRNDGSNALFTHVTWADLVLATGSHPPYRLGMTPTNMDN